MTVYLDTTALLALLIPGRPRTIVLELLKSDSDWCSSAIALPEALAGAHRMSDQVVLREKLVRDIRSMWEAIAIIPVDQTCVSEAERLICDQPIGISTAIHLAAAQRLPRPLFFATFDSSQIPIALGLEFKVASA